MKVLLINGSPNAEGNTAAALKEVAAALNAEGVETDTVCIGTKPVCCSTNQRHLWPWPVVQARWPRSTVSTNISA